MAVIKVKEQHSLPNTSIKSRIDTYFRNIKKKNQQLVDTMVIKWDGKSADIKLDVVGLKIKGNILLEDEHVIVTGELPPVAAEYKDQLEHIVKYELSELLN